MDHKCTLEIVDAIRELADAIRELARTQAPFDEDIEDPLSEQSMD